LNSGWIIEEQCPQCGAPVTLKETDRLFSCTFCRVKLYIMSSGFFRYCIPPPEDLEEEIVYAPYWRFRGMSFSLSQQGLKHRVIDTSFPATGYDFLPPSLGLRPQTQKLKFMSPEIKGKFLKQKIPFKQIFSNIKAEEKTSAEQIENPSVFLQSFIGETTSLIYAPFYLKDYRFHDAILKSPVQTESDNKPRSVPLEKTQNWNRSFQPTLCPLCGWDLNGEKESCILICNNCHSAWKASLLDLKGTGLKLFRYRVIISFTSRFGKCRPMWMSCSCTPMLTWPDLQTSRKPQTGPGKKKNCISGHPHSRWLQNCFCACQNS